MDRFIECYELTGDKEWLDAGIKYYDHLLNKRGTDPDVTRSGLSYPANKQMDVAEVFLRIHRINSGYREVPVVI